MAFQTRRDSYDDIHGMRFRDSMAPNQYSPRSTPLTIVNNVSLRYTIQYKTLHSKRMPIEVYSCLVIKVLQYGLGKSQITQYRPRCEFHGSIGPMTMLPHNQFDRSLSVHCYRVSEHRSIDILFICVSENSRDSIKALYVREGTTFEFQNAEVNNNSKGTNNGSF